MKKDKRVVVSNMRIPLACLLIVYYFKSVCWLWTFSVLWCADAASKAAEAVWREKARKELEDWHVHQSEQMEKNKANNRYFHSEIQALLIELYVFVSEN